MVPNIYIYLCPQNQKNHKEKSPNYISIMFGSARETNRQLCGGFGTGTVGPAKVWNRFRTGSGAGSKDTPPNDG